MAQKFEVSKVSLTDKINVEASAGTGKTYSIAILVLRTIIEKNISIDEMLIVTFTNDAVEELQSRIRLFINNAYQYLRNENYPVDDVIKNILENTSDKESAYEKLKQSLYLLDEANIMTIHGFAQKMLNEYAFETHQDFGETLVADINDVIENVCNIFWRNEVTSLDSNVLTMIGDLTNFKQSLPEFVRKIRAQQIYLNENGHENIKQNIEQSTNLIKEIYEEELANLKTGLSFNKENIGQIIENKYSRYLSKYWQAGIISFIETIVDRLAKEKVPGYIMKFLENDFPELLPLFEKYMEAKLQCDDLYFSITSGLKTILKNQYLHLIDKQLHASRILTFDDLIKRLRDNIIANQNDNQQLITAIRANFKAVFIDEFQDTDATQFEIFNALFIDKNYDGAVFLIGDPKQSIYAFRGADVESYLRAKELIEATHHYTMQTNYRSVDRLVGQVNDFYQGIDGFGFGDSQQITYQTVEAIKEDDLKGIDYQYLQFFKYKNQTEIFDNLGNYILDKLTNPNIEILENDTFKKLRPNDFCILVRSKKDGKKAQTALALKNIPAVLVLDQKVLDTKEMDDVIYLFETMLSPNFQTIRKALFLSFLNYDINDLDSLDDAKKLELTIQFLNYNQLMHQKSIYQAFDTLLQDFNINYTFSDNTVNQRILTNVRLIIEIINKKQFKEGKTPEEILQWMYHAKDNPAETDDEYTLQIESDDDAVKIATIHSSKGLEYNWVIILGMEKSMKPSNFYQYVNFKKDGQTFLAENNHYEGYEELYAEQTNQELKRLLYVAITRAKFKCDFFISTHSFNDSTLASFEEKVARYEDFYSSDNDELYQQEEATNISTIALPPNLNTSMDLWRKQSFSALSKHQVWEQNYQKEVNNNSYDTFVFEQLSRGTIVGNQLHNLMETIPFNLDYSLTENLPQYIIKKLSLFNTIEKDYTKQVLQLLTHILNVPIKTPQQTIQLKNINEHQKLIELEFNYNIDGNITSFCQVLDAYEFPYQLNDYAALKGMMNGKIDLFFEQDGQYFILDWKSNYLGNHLSAYDSAVLTEAMTVNGYHLQYLLYTIAVYKFLKNRLPNFDYDIHLGGAIYVFIRGVRENSETGIFFNKPDKELIEKLVEILG